MGLFCGVAELLPIIEIDPTVEHNIILRDLYYRPGGYHKNARNLLIDLKKEGYNFKIRDIHDWLHRQAIWQVYAPPPKYIPCVSFNNVIVPNKLHQWDLLVIPPEISGLEIYLYLQTVKDVASRYGWAVLRTNKTSAQTVAVFEEVYNDPDIALIYPEELMTDKGGEFLGHCEKFYSKHDISHIQAETKESMGINERFNRTIIENVFPIQYAQEMLLPLTERSRVLSNILHPILIKINNSPTRLINMCPADAIKKQYVYAKPSKPRKGPIGFDEVRLSHNDLVRYLLKPGELEGGRKRSGDLIWSPQIYHIKESMVQKNQPVLYWLENDEGNDPKRSFVREELMLIPHNTELPPKNILNH